MTFFSGFGFKYEQKLFETYLNSSKYAVVGFSYGTQKAVEYALKHDGRVDTLQLFSPAFFQRVPEKFKLSQIAKFEADKSKYMLDFRLKCLDGLNIDEYKEYFVDGTKEELSSLLYYEFKNADLKNLIQKGIKIEVYLGTNDKIIDVVGAKEFFIRYATIYEIKNANHILEFLQNSI